MKNNNIIIFILFVIIIYFIYCDNIKNKRIKRIEEKFAQTSQSSSTDVTTTTNPVNEEIQKKIDQKINQYLYEREKIPITESIKNLGIISKKIQDGEFLTTPSNFRVFGDLNVNRNCKFDGGMNVVGDMNVVGNINFLPAGCIIMWSSSEIPNGWVKCDGRYYLRNEFKNIGLPLSISNEDFNNINNKNKYINTPDLRGRFIIGEGQSMGTNGLPTLKYNGATGNSKYSTEYYLNNIGGWEQHKLTTDEIPKHKHSIQRNDFNSNSDYDQGLDHDNRGNIVAPGDKHKSTNGQDHDNKTAIINTKETGEDKPHDNIPPYYVLIYIMKI